MERSGAIYLQWFFKRLYYFVLLCIDDGYDVILQRGQLANGGTGGCLAGDCDGGTVWTPGDVDVLSLGRDFSDGVLRCEGAKVRLCEDGRGWNAGTSVVPEADGPVMRGADEMVGVCRVPTDLVDSLQVAFELEGIAHLGLLGIPDADCLVCGSRGEARAGDVPCHGSHAVLMPCQHNGRVGLWCHGTRSRLISGLPRLASQILIHPMDRYEAREVAKIL